MLNGLIAGAGLDRLLVQRPAFRRIGLRHWAAFSRQADLRTGIFWYPVLAIGGTALSLSAVATARHGHEGARSRRPSLSTAALATAGLLATTKAAPHMLSLRDGRNDPDRLKCAYDGFVRWSLVREGFQALAFVANVWALRASRSA